VEFEDEGKKRQWNLKKYFLLRVMLSTFMKDAIFWDVARRRFFEVSKETVAEILHTEEGSKHKPFPEIFLSFYQTTRRHIPKIMLLFFYS
jgi:hypothetical protein